jgi:hypothetical protein
MLRIAMPQRVRDTRLAAGERKKFLTAILTKILYPFVLLNEGRCHEAS